MNYSKIGVRYAKALLLAAVESDLLEKIKNDMLFLDAVIASVPDFNRVLLSPVIKPSEKQNIFNLTFSSALSSLTIKFLNILITHHRESRLADISRNFFEQYKRHKGILTAFLVTPVAIDDVSKNKIAELLHIKYNKIINLSLTINPSIIGGFILQVEDLQYDSSVQTRLKKIHQELINIPINN